MFRRIFLIAGFGRAVIRIVENDIQVISRGPQALPPRDDKVINGVVKLAKLETIRIDNGGIRIIVDDLVAKGSEGGVRDLSRVILLPIIRGVFQPGEDSQLHTVETKVIATRSSTLGMAALT